jgi:lipid-binding SYLF domain-containing protein
MRTPIRFVALLIPCGLILAAAGCETAPKTPAARNALRDQGQAAVKAMRADFPKVGEAIDSGYGYAVFPEVTKAGAVVGGGYGRGSVYEQGRFIGYADITKVSAGAQVGAQTFRELIVFQNKEALERFKSSKLKFDANASAVILNAGGAVTADYTDGVLVYCQPVGGAMAEASVGGQEFGFVPAGGE